MKNKITNGDAGMVQNGPEIEERTGQPIEDAEKNLSRHTTKDSSPPVKEQSRTSVSLDKDGQ